MQYLLATDLDHTLLVNGKIPEENQKALIEWHERGNIVCFCSGRAISSLRALAAALPFPIYLIGCNGAIIAEGERIIHSNPIQRDTFVQLCALAKEEHLFFHTYDQQAYYAEVLDAGRIRHLENPKKPGAYQLPICIFPNLEEIPTDFLKFQLHLQGDHVRIENEVQQLGDLECTYAMENLLEIMNIGSRKWAALQILSDYLRISKDCIVSFGDYENDREMIANAGFGIAMGDGLASVQKCADWVAPAHDQFGVAAGIEYVLTNGFKKVR